MAAAGLVATAFATAGRYESPRYTSVETHDAFEIRDYAPRRHAEITVTGTQREGASAAFRILAGYIFGRNQPSDAIGMTAPVGQQPVAEDRQEWIVWFMMPSRYTIDTQRQPHPAPRGPRSHGRCALLQRACSLTDLRDVRC